MESQKCKNFGTCNAPLCPLYGCSDVWYPLVDEICKSTTYGRINWVRNQKKIAKKTVDDYSIYTVRMLERDCKITKGIMGLDPDLTLDKVKREEEKWLSKHPEKPEKSEAEKAEIKNRLKKGLDLSKKEACNKGKDEKI